MSRKEKILLSSLVVSVGFAAAFIRIFYQGTVLGKPYPPLFTPPVSRFGDFFQIWTDWYLHGFNVVAYGLSYFPSAYLLVEPLTWTGNPWIAVRIFLTIYCVAMFAFAFSLGRAIPIRRFAFTGGRCSSDCLCC